MNEGSDNVLSSVKESDKTVGSKEIERDEGMMVDVVSDDAGGKEASDDLGEREVVNLEKSEVVKEVIIETAVTTVVTTTVVTGSGCDDQKSGNGSAVGESKKTVSGSSKPLSEETEARGGEIEVREKYKKETEVVSSVKVAETKDCGVVAVDEGLVSKEKAEGGVDIQSLVTEVVGSGTGEGEGEDDVDVSAKNAENKDGVDQEKKESFESTVEEDSKMAVESTNVVTQVSIKEEGSVMIEKTVKDEVLVAEVVVDEKVEILEPKAEVDQIKNEGSLQSTVEVKTEDDSKLKDSKMDVEPQIIEGGLTKEAVEQPMASVQVADGDHVMDEKTVKDDAVNSSKNSQSSTMASVGLEDDVDVVVDDGVEGKDKAQDSVSVEPSLVCPDKQSLSTEAVNAGTREVDVKVADEGMDIDEVLGWKDDGLEKQQNTETIDVKPSFKVGSIVQKVASQPPAEETAGNTVSAQSPGPIQMGDQEDMLSQLHLAAQDPMKGYSFVHTLVPFLNGHRAAVSSKLRLNSSGEARKRKSSNGNEADEFEFDDVKDSYWTDRVIQNHPEEQVFQENPTGDEKHQIVAYGQENQPPVKPPRRSNKKRFFSSNHEIEANEQSDLIARRQQNLATEVLMKFAGGIYFPSEIHLNKMFRRFGPLMESETEVDRQSGRARVVFKKCSDAEVAHSSAGKFNIFGSISVNYDLNYTPLISYKPLPLPLTQDSGHAC